MKKAYRTNVIVSQRGQITLPAPLRHRLGIQDGDVVTLEERRGELVLCPAAVVPVEVYSDADIEGWDRADQLSARERVALRRKLSKKAR